MELFANFVNTHALSTNQQYKDHYAAFFSKMEAYAARLILVIHLASGQREATGADTTAKAQNKTAVKTINEKAVSPLDYKGETALEDGAGDEIRTHGILLGKVTLENSNQPHNNDLPESQKFKAQHEALKIEKQPLSRANSQNKKLPKSGKKPAAKKAAEPAADRAGGRCDRPGDHFWRNSDAGRSNFGD